MVHRGHRHRVSRARSAAEGWRSCSRVPRGHQTAAPALDPLNAAARTEPEGYINDAKVVRAEPTEKAADEFP